MNGESGMFQVSMLLKEQQLKEQQAQYKALQDEYFKVVNSGIWRRTQWLRNAVNLLRGRRTAPPAADPAAAPPAPETAAPPVMLPPARMDTETLLRQLREYDVISFDIFDTLLLRRVADPKDVFTLTAQKLGMESFARLRAEAEAEARRRVTGKEKEVELVQIYTVLGEWLGIDIRAAMRAEIDTELAVCMANPYMKRLFDALRSMGKELITVSDMYLPKKTLERLLESCGYSGFSAVYVSCEQLHSKASGTLYRHVAAALGEKKVIHIGDNYCSDVENARAAGWAAWYYPPVQTLAGDAFAGCISPAGSLHTGLCRAALCADSHPLSAGFCHGYGYGGILSVGYCRWLERFAAEKKAEKILFLARDCEIFDVLWRTHINTLPCSYMTVSRFALWQLVFDIHTEEYIRFFFYARAQAADTTVADALTETGLECLLPELPARGLAPEALLDAETYPALRELIYAARELIAGKLAPQREAATAYFNACFGDAKRIVVADVGWSGQILLQLRHFVRDVMHRTDVELIGGYMAAAVTPAANPYINSGVLNAWLFTYGQNRDMIIPNDTLWGNTAVMCFEAMFSSAAPTLMRYTLRPDGGCGFEYGEQTGDAAIINEVQRGILAFARDWFEACGRLGFEPAITAADAFAPYEPVAADWKYLERVFGDFQEYTDSLPRLGRTRSRSTLRRIMLQRGLL
ncbi:MAG: HAD-IA family hydrolase [Oscillospiraceae bacterium]|nr:HAD-IA family hydrolase [Oscillospiraceae bacterium]